MTTRRSSRPGVIQVDDRIHRARAPQPFADFTLRQVRRTITDRLTNPDELEVSAALTALLTRAGDGLQEREARTRKTTRRVAAKTRAAAPAAVTAQRQRAIQANDREDHEQPDDSDLGEQKITSAPFGLFDAHAEARRIW